MCTDRLIVVDRDWADPGRVAKLGKTAAYAEPAAANDENSLSRSESQPERSSTPQNTSTRTAVFFTEALHIRS